MNSFMVLFAVAALGGDLDFSSVAPEIILAVNCNAGFGAALDGSSLSFIPMPVEAASWHVILSHSSIGRGERLHALPVKPEFLRRERRFVELGRGCVVEGYTNESNGLHLQWLVTSPASPITDDPLALSWQLTTNLGAKPSDDARAVYFHDGSDARVLRLGNLAARDATGQSLKTWLASGSSLRIYVDDGQARYPLTVELLIGSPSWSLDGDQDHAALGKAVFAAGDVNGDGFSDLAVGAPLHDGSAGADCGRVLVFHGSPSGISMPAVWDQEGDQAGAQFGASLSTGGSVNGDEWDDLIVGSPLHDIGAADEGRAVVHFGSASGLQTLGSWTIDGSQAGAQFGSSVSLAGDVNGDRFWDLVIGAPLLANGETEEGCVFVFQGSASTMPPSASWTAESDQAGARLGASASTAGDVNGDGFHDLIAGAPLYDLVEQDRGRAFLWLGSASGLSTSPDWQEIGPAGARYGSSVALAGDTNADGFGDIVIGAPHADSMERGLAYLYRGSAGGLDPSPLVLSLGQDAAHFGATVATAGDANGDGIADLLIGAPDHDGAADDEGWVGLYLGSREGIARTPVLLASVLGTQAGANAGAALSTAGDVNGDGRSDLLIGAPGYDDDQMDEGRATLLLGQSGVLGPLEPSPVGAYAGDVNGDGFSDAIHGDPGYDGSQTDQGRVLVHAGSPEGLDRTPLADITRPFAYLRLGRSVSTAGDVNGDGYDDIVYGAWRNAFATFGSPAGPPDAIHWSHLGGNPSFGKKVGTAGDQNGDGFLDLFVHSGHRDPFPTHLFWGSRNGLPDAATFQLFTGIIGYDASSAGDFNRDGYSDFAFSDDDLNLYHWGRIRFLRGSPAGLLLVTAYPSTAECENYFGRPLGWVGDLNRDGRSETAVAEPILCAGPPPRAHVYFDVNQSNPRWTVFHGGSGTPVGDVNADGYSDLFIGNRLLLGSSTGPVDSGVSSPDPPFPGGGDVNGDGYSDVLGSGGVRFGGESRGVSYAPQQLRSDLAAPVALLGSASGNSIALRANGRSPAGRDRVQLEWQMALLHEPLEGSSIDFSSTMDSGSPTPDGSFVPLIGYAEHLEPGGNYHWRARIASDHPLFPRSIWFTLPNSNSSEQKFRVPDLSGADTPTSETPLRIR